ncbi:Cytochrome P450 4V2, partial [Orchesella cincta]
IFVQGLHKNPKYFPNPEKFIPERFSDEETKARHSYAYIPFAGGQRKCIGYKFAMLEVITLSAKLLRHFVWETSETFEKLVFLPHVTITPERPIKFVFKKRP